MTMFGLVFIGIAVSLAAIALLGNAAAWKLEEWRESRKRS